MSIDIRDHGARGQGANDTAAIQAAIDTAHATGGDLVHFPTGHWCSGTVFLKSGVHIEVPTGSTWAGLGDLALYPDIGPDKRSRMDTTPWKAFIYAFDQQDIGLCGGGTIHPGGEQDAFQDGKGNSPQRPYGIHFVACRDVLVRDLHLRNSAFWMQRYLACDGVRLTGLRIWNHCNLNNDGSDIDSCRNVIVSDCRIDSSDDALCLKSEGADACENVVVTNCILSSEASAIKFGTASIGGFKRVTISNCVVRPSASPVITHALKARHGLMGIDLGNVDGGVMQDITISNIAIEGTETPIFVKLGDRQSRSDRGGPWDDAPPPRPGRIERVRIDNISATDCGPIASCLVGYPGYRLRNVRLTRIHIACGMGVDEQPDYEVDTHAKLYPMNRIFNSPLPAYGLYLRDVDGLELEDIRLEPAAGDPRPAVVVEDATDVHLQRLQAGSDANETVVLRNCERVRRD
ncbi:MAG: glycoside hydrolase family 28 protein [Planctomycetota bacterium]